MIQFTLTLGRRPEGEYSGVLSSRPEARPIFVILRREDFFVILRRDSSRRISGSNPTGASCCLLSF